MSENKILEEANFYLSSDKSLKEVAKELEISTKTLQLHIKKLEDIDINLYKLVRAKQKQIEAHIKGGSNGKRSASYTKEKAIYIAQEIISKQLTYKEAEEIYGIPKSTIYEMVHSKLVSEDLKTKLDITSSANIHKVSIEQYQEETSNGYRLR